MPTYTDQQLLDAARGALYTILSGAQSYTFNGRQVTKADLAQLRIIIAELEQKVGAAAGGGIGGGTLLAKFGEPQ